MEEGLSRKLKQKTSPYKSTNETNKLINRTMEKEIEKMIAKERQKLTEVLPTSKEAGEIQKRIQDLTNTLLWFKNE